MRRFLSTFATFAVSETSVRSHRGRISVCRRRQFLTLPFPAGKRGSQASVRPIETSDRGRFPGPGRNHPGALGLGSFLSPFILPGSLSAWKQESLKTVKEKGFLGFWGCLLSSSCWGQFRDHRVAFTGRLEGGDPAVSCGCVGVCARRAAPLPPPAAHKRRES